MRILTDTLKNKGRWSQKRLMTFSSFFVAVVYAFMPLLKPEFDVKEFVFIGILASGGFSLYRTQKQNENNINTDTQ